MISRPFCSKSRELLRLRRRLCLPPLVSLSHAVDIVQPCRRRRHFHVSSSALTGSGSGGALKDILERVSRGELDPETALTRMHADFTINNDNDALLKSFANLDHQRSERTGFPEAVFAQGKTSQQVATLLDNMAKNATSKWQLQQQHQQKFEHHGIDVVPSAILATRVTSGMFLDLSKISMQHGELEYHETARIVSMKPHGIDTATAAAATIDKSTSHRRQRHRVVVATAGTTDIFVAEEAAIVLELATGAGVKVDRIYDAGVAGLHRIVQALPRLRHADVGAVIVCAGMDGALPSVVGGLVSVPVIAVPTSIGYGASFGGVSALLTMLNSCAPGVGVVNIDNGFGAAVLAFKCLGREQR